MLLTWRVLMPHLEYISNLEDPVIVELALHMDQRVTMLASLLTILLGQR
jgi:hypothetical protein